MNKAEYEANQPQGSQKLEFDDFVIRAYVKDGELVVKAHRKDVDGFEQLPLGYIMGSNYLTLKGSKPKQETSADYHIGFTK